MEDKADFYFCICVQEKTKGELNQFISNIFSLTFDDFTKKGKRDSNHSITNLLFYLLFPPFCALWPPPVDSAEDAQISDFVLFRLLGLFFDFVAPSSVEIRHQLRKHSFVNTRFLEKGEERFD